MTTLRTVTGVSPVDAALLPRPRAGFVPMYVQVRDALVESIERQELREGDRLPSESALCTRFGVGLPTVRQALALLRQEGWLVTRRGAGTFVARGSRSISLLGFAGLTRMLEARGLATDDDILATDVADHPTTRVLDARDVAGPWFVVTRLRRLAGDQTPICLEYDAFSLAACPDAEAWFERRRSAAAVLEDGSGYTIGSCDVATEAVAATPAEARLLDVRRGAPLLRMERLNRATTGETVHAAIFLVRTDRVPVVETLVNTTAQGRQ